MQTDDGRVISNFIVQALKNKGFECILNDLYGVYERSSDIDVNQLPEKFVLKASHGSGMNIICTDKSKFDWKRVKKQLDR